MEITPKMLEEFKEIYRKEKGKELSDQEAWEAAHNLLNLTKLLLDLGAKDAQRKARLKKEPDGFPVDGDYSCLICRNSINSSNGWYDWYGQTCLLCRKAIQDGTIPAFICKERDSYFLTWQLKSTFDIHRSQVNKYIKEGKFIARAILNENGKVHEYVFLKKENPQLIERYTSARKSYDRHRDKEHRVWTREQKKKWREEMVSKKRKAKKSS